MNSLTKRVERLEKKAKPNEKWKPRPMIIVDSGESAVEKIADYKREHNHTGDDFIIIQLVESPEAKKHGQK